MRYKKDFFNFSNINLCYVLLFGSIFLVACKSEPQNKITVETQVIQGYGKIVFANYEDALLLALEMQKSIQKFLSDPNKENLEEAKKTWINARSAYSKTEVYRFYDGPIDNSENGVEGLLNAWPLDEAYVDYVDGFPETGIINNTIGYPEITKDVLIQLNENGGEENISIGFHAIEFLLWGQDLSPDGPGNRAPEDYLPLSPNSERRKLYLQICTEILIEHLTLVTHAWKPEVPDNYRSQFEKLPVDESLQKIITGMAVLSKIEMAGERMFTAYDNANQEDEQSCFSDNTKSDLIFNLGGIVQIFYGTYVRNDKSTIEVYGIGELVKKSHPSLYLETEQQIKDCMSNLHQMHQPFDQALILEDKRPQVLKAVLAMQKLGDQFAVLAEALELNINVKAVE